MIESKIPSLIIILLSIIAAVLLGVVTNWIYDLLRKGSILPGNPTPKVVLVVVIASLPLVLLVASPQLLPPSGEDNFEALAATIIANNGARQALEATRLALETIQASITEQSGSSADATRTAIAHESISLQGTIEALEKAATQHAQLITPRTGTTPTMTLLLPNPTLTPTVPAPPLPNPVPASVTPKKVPPSRTPLPPTQEPSKTATNTPTATSTSTATSTPSATDTPTLSFTWDTQITCAYIENRVNNSNPVQVQVTGFISARPDGGDDETISEVPPPYQSCPSGGWCGPIEDIRNHYTTFQGVVWGTTWVHYQGVEVAWKSFGPTTLSCNP